MDKGLQVVACELIKDVVKTTKEKDLELIVITNYKDWIFIDSIDLDWVQSLRIQSSDSFSFKDGFFQPLNHGGIGLFIGKPSLWKLRALTWVLGFDLDFGPFNQALSWTTLTFIYLLWLWLWLESILGLSWALTWKSLWALTRRWLESRFWCLTCKPM